MTPRRTRRLVVAATVAALALSGGPPAAAEREPARGAPEAEFEAAERPYLPALAPDWGKRVTGRADEGRRVEVPTPAGLRTPDTSTPRRPPPADGECPSPGPLVRWCLSHSTSTAAP